MNLDQFKDKVRQAYGRRTEFVQIATVLHEGWELDNYVALINTSAGDRLLVTTTHGRLTTTTADYLHEALNHHNKASASINATLAALGD